MYTLCSYNKPQFGRLTVWCFVRSDKARLELNLVNHPISQHEAEGWYRLRSADVDLGLGGIVCSVNV